MSFGLSFLKCVGADEGAAREKREKEEKESLARREQEEIERGEFFECGCCFGECGFSQLGASDRPSPSRRLNNVVVGSDLHRRLPVLLRVRRSEREQPDRNAQVRASFLLPLSSADRSLNNLRRSSLA